MPPQKTKKKKPRIALQPGYFPSPSLPTSLQFPDIAKANDTTESRQHARTLTRTPINATTFIPIATQFATISSRELSFHDWPHTNLTPQQLARLGFYHNPCDEGHDNVRCFACGEEVLSWDPVGPYTEEELLEQHEKGCLWADMRRDARLCAESSVQQTPAVTTALSTSTNSPPQTNILPDARPPIREQSPELPTREPTAPPQTPPTTPPISPPTSPKTTKPTYASVLKTPLRSDWNRTAPKSSTPTPQSPTSPWSTSTPTTRPHRNAPTPTLTIEDLHNRFHNKPSPFKPNRFNKQNTDIPHYHLAMNATDSLSRFLLLALPAFTRFLSDIQGGQQHTPRKWLQRM